MPNLIVTPLCSFFSKSLITQEHLLYDSLLRVGMVSLLDGAWEEEAVLGSASRLQSSLLVPCFP